MPYSNYLYVCAAVHWTPSTVAQQPMLCACISAYISMIPSSGRPVLWLLQVKILSSLITAVLPGLVLTIFLALLPAILALLNKKVQKMVSETDVEFGVVRKFFVFQVGSCSLATPSGPCCRKPSLCWILCHEAIQCHGLLLIFWMCWSPGCAQVFSCTVLPLHIHLGRGGHMAVCMPLLLKFMLITSHSMWCHMCSVHFAHADLIGNTAHGSIR